MHLRMGLLTYWLHGPQWERKTWFRWWECLAPSWWPGCWLLPLGLPPIQTAAWRAPGFHGLAPTSAFLVDWGRPAVYDILYINHVFLYYYYLTYSMKTYNCFIWIKIILKTICLNISHSHFPWTHKSVELYKKIFNATYSQLVNTRPSFCTYVCNLE